MTVRRQVTLDAIAARPCLLSFRHLVKWAWQPLLLKTVRRISIRSPGGDSLLFALRCSDRRRIGEVGAGRSHPRSRRRSESRAHQAGSLARVPPRPSLAGELYYRLRTGTVVARRKSRTMLAKLCRCLGTSPLEYLPVAPHGVQYDREFTRQRHPCPPDSYTLCQAHGPCFERTP